jgi:hypothetical protein
VTTAQWRTLTLVLAVVFLVVVALLVIIILNRTGDGGLGSTATPTPIATGPSASPSGDGSISPSPSAAASAAASPSSGPSPSGRAVVPPARANIRGLGVDDKGSPQATPRIIVFSSEGGADVTVKLQQATGGKVVFCLYPGTLATPVGDPACLTTTGSTLTGHSKGKKPFTWTVTLAGAKKGTTPAVDLRIDWATTTPTLEISDFRLQGKGAEPYNGVEVELGARAEAGPLTFVASWSDPVGGDTHPYKATITDRESGAVLDSDDGEGSNVALGANLLAGQRAAARLLNPGPVVATEVIAALTITWP